MKKNVLRCSIFLLPIVFLSGCISHMHQPMTDEERLDQEYRMRGALYDTSPRAMNRLPKAIPSFRKTYTPEGSTPAEVVPIEEQ